jgi:hypothetical protein
MKGSKEAKKKKHSKVENDEKEFRFFSTYKDLFGKVLIGGWKTLKLFYLIYYSLFDPKHVFIQTKFSYDL